jgi:hypothetical protein
LKCFRYDKKGEKAELTWLSYLESKINKAFIKSEENNNYGFSDNEIKKLENT